VEDQAHQRLGRRLGRLERFCISDGELFTGIQADKFKVRRQSIVEQKIGNNPFACLDRFEKRLLKHI